MVYKKGDTRRNYCWRDKPQGNSNSQTGGMSNNNRKNKQINTSTEKNTPPIGTTTNPQFLPRLRSSTLKSLPGNFSATNTNSFIPEYMRKDCQFCQGTRKQQRREEPTIPQTKTQSDLSPTNMEKEPTNGEHFNNKHLPIDPISLADIISRLDNLAHIPQKIDAMAEDLKQIKVLQETTIKMGKDISRVQADVHQLQQSVSQFQQDKVKSKNDLSQTQTKVQRLSTKVATLEADRLKNEQNQQALAKELLALRSKIKQLENKLQESSVKLSVPEFEFHKIDAALRIQNLIIEGIREPRYERDGSTGDQVFHFFHNVLGLSRIEIDMA